MYGGEVFFELLDPTGAEDDSVPVRDVKLRVVRKPAQRRCGRFNAGAGTGFAELAQHAEIIRFPVAHAVARADAETAVVGQRFDRFVLAAQQAAGERVVGVEADAVVAQARDEFRFDAAGAPAACVIADDPIANALDNLAELLYRRSDH